MMMIIIIIIATPMNIHNVRHLYIFIYSNLYIYKYLYIYIYLFVYIFYIFSHVYGLVYLHFQLFYVLLLSISLPVMLTLFVCRDVVKFHSGKSKSKSKSKSTGPTVIRLATYNKRQNLSEPYHLTTSTEKCVLKWKVINTFYKCLWFAAKYTNKTLGSLAVQR